MEEHAAKGRGCGIRSRMRNGAYLASAETPRARLKGLGWVLLMETTWSRRGEWSCHTLFTQLCLEEAALWQMELNRGARVLGIPIPFSPKARRRQSFLLRLRARLIIMQVSLGPVLTKAMRATRQLSGIGLPTRGQMACLGGIRAMDMCFVSPVRDGRKQD